MKKILFLLIAIMFGSQVFSQTDDKVIFGTVRTDGFSFVKKGAMWAKRPFAKIVYEGGDAPEGYRIIILDANNFMRFKFGEFNALDRNYIVVPVFEKVVEEIATGKRFLAYCGNEIEYMAKVGSVEIIDNRIDDSEKISILGNQPDLGGLLKPDLPKDLGSSIVVKDNSYLLKTPDLNLNPTTTPSWWKKNRKWVIPLASAAVVTGTGFIAHNRNHSWYFWFPKDGAPVGVPVHWD